MPPPVPPSVYAGRTTSGRPISFAARRASSIVVTVAPSGTGSPISASSLPKRARSSAVRIVSIGVPSERRSYFSSTPASSSATARFSPVCPPRVGSRPSGFSRAMMRSITGTVSGSM